MSKRKIKKEVTFERKIDRYFHELDLWLGTADTKFVFPIFLVFFGVMGIIWLIPFPQLSFLDRINAQTFLNWGSFFIAIVVYCYLKLAPTLSYAMLLLIGVMSFLIVQMEYVERDYGISAILVFTGITIIALILLFLSLKSSGKSLNRQQFFKVLAIGPIWAWSKLFKRLGWKY